ncbi:MAG: hypothetical protein JWM14_576 [Chitinophagaceae bacterium]|nr:hypothetical protein [Chitinophagaceae bacterium]
MQKIIVTLGLYFVSILAYGQVKPGVYTLEYSYKNSLTTDNKEGGGHYNAETLTIDSLGADGSYTFSGYIEGNACVIVVIKGHWTCKDNILTYASESITERDKCSKKFSRPRKEKGYDGITHYKIVKFSEDSFLGEAVEDPNVKVKWTRKK